MKTKSQCEMLHKYTCMCVRACECKEIYWKHLRKASVRKYGGGVTEIGTAGDAFKLIAFYLWLVRRPRKPKSELELNWENLQAACFVCFTKLPASMQKPKREDVAEQQRGRGPYNWKTLIKRSRVWKQTNVMPARAFWGPLFIQVPSEWVAKTNVGSN